MAQVKTDKRILVVDDHPLLREGVVHNLSKQFKDAIFAEVATGQAALAAVRSQRWDIVLLDLTLPDRGGLEVLQELARFDSKPSVLVVSMHPEVEFAKEALRLGADGYITKSKAADELGHAVRKVLSGGKYVSPAFAEALVAELSTKPQREPHERLSKREFEVLSCIAGGKSVSQIARELSISVKTVSTFRRRLLRKMNMQTNNEIIRYAIMRGLT